MPGRIIFAIKPSRSYLSLTPGRDGNSVDKHTLQKYWPPEIQVMKSREISEQLTKELPFPDKDWLPDGLTLSDKYSGG